MKYIQFFKILLIWVGIILLGIVVLLGSIFTGFLGLALYTLFLAIYLINLLKKAQQKYSNSLFVKIFTTILILLLFILIGLSVFTIGVTLFSGLF